MGNSDIQLRAERAVLYALFLMPEKVHAIMGKIRPFMFTNYANKVLFECSVEVYSRGESVDTISVFKEVMTLDSADKNKARKEHGDIVTHFQHLTYSELENAIMMIMSESVRNEHIELALEINTIAKSESYDPKSVLDRLQEHISQNRLKDFTNKKEYSNSELLDGLEDSMRKARENKGIIGIESGYEEFDECIGGARNTNLIIVAARPAMGKTQWALGFMNYASVENNKKGLFISTEMDEVQVMKRVVAINGDINGYSIKRGKLDRMEGIRYAQSKEKILTSSFSVVSGSFTINEIVAEAHRRKHAEGLDYLVVDYVQKVRSPRYSNRNNEVEDVTAKLKDLANELKIPVIALAQLSRAVEQRVDKRPMLSDLRDSGAIEQDADIVLFLYRNSYYIPDEEKKTWNDPLHQLDDAYMLIAKHRDGELADIKMKFIEEIPAWKNLYERPRYVAVQEELDLPEETVSAMQPNQDFDNGLPF